MVLRLRKFIQELLGERTIRSETTKAFLYVFVILVLMSVFTVGASILGSRTFEAVKDVYLQQFRSANAMNEKAQEIIGIFYLVSGESDLEIQMENMTRYDTLVKDFDASLLNFKSLLEKNASGTVKEKLISSLDEVQALFKELNANCQEIVVASMEGRKDHAKKFFKILYGNIAEFKKKLAFLQTTVASELDGEVLVAQNQLKFTIAAGTFFGFFSIVISMLLIYRLMGFLSVSLLPISNLMHHLRQSVFTVDKDYKVMSPASNYSKSVFEQDIVGKDVYDLVYRDMDKHSPHFSLLQTSMISSFGSDELQWMLIEDGFPKQVERRYGEDRSKILQLNYTPLWNEQGLLQSIMIVAEDVTEFERLKAQALKAQGRGQIVESLLAIEKNDLIEFQRSSLGLFEESETLLTSVGQNKESGAHLFRLLHTLKGNSHLFKFHDLVNKIHKAEHELVDVRSLVEGGQTVASDKLRKLQDCFYLACTSFAELGLVAQKIFKISNITIHASMRRLITLLSQFELRWDLKRSATPFPEIDDLGFDASSYLSLVVSWDNERIASEIIKIFDLFDASEVKARFLELDATQAQTWQEFQAQLQRLLDGLEIESLPASFSKQGNTESTLLGYWVDSQKAPATPELRSLLKSSILLNRDYEAALLLRELSQTATQSKNSCSEETLAHILAAQCRELSFTFALLGPEEVKSDGLRVLKQCRTIRSFVASEWLQQNKEIQPIVKYLHMLLDLVQKLPTEITARLGVRDEEVFLETLLGIHLQNRDLQSFLDGRDKVSLSADKAELNSIWRQISSLTLGFTHQLDFKWRLKVVSLEGSVSSSQDRSQLIEVPMSDLSSLGQTIQDLRKVLPVSMDSLGGTVQTRFEAIFHEPIKQICLKMKTLVLDLSRELGKPVAFNVSGDEIRIPREKTPIIKEVLMHMIRNSMDHGVEDASGRSLANKPSQASLQIRCIEREKNLEVIVTDDGRGIDVERVVAKAIAMGHVTAEQAATLSLEAKLNLIFIRSLSTKESVTNLSGRGVGMDAVKAAIEQQLQGQILVDSQVGKGTQFKIFIPKVGYTELQALAS